MPVPENKVRKDEASLEDQMPRSLLPQKCWQNSATNFQHENNQPLGLFEITLGFGLLKMEIFTDS